MTGLSASQVQGRGLRHNQELKYGDFAVPLSAPSGYRHLLPVPATDNSERMPEWIMPS